MPYLLFFEKAAKFEIVICCKLKVALYGLRKLAEKSLRWQKLWLADSGLICSNTVKPVLNITRK